MRLFTSLKLSFGAGNNGGFRYQPDFSAYFIRLSAGRSPLFGLPLQ
jgi:hypothetical protein